MTRAATRLGYGVGLRPEHYPDVLARSRPAVDWFEVISENFMDTGGRPLATLERVRRERPVVLHGVGLSIGSTDPLDDRYLASLERLVRRIEPALVSDHLCWTGVGGHNTHDLLPLPHSEEALAHVAQRVERVQERLGRRILLENVSSYVRFRHADLTEWEFLSEVSRRSDCAILLDVNNVYVNSVNHGFDPRDYLDAIPPRRVEQIHLAGHSDRGSYLFDTHDAPVCDAVWDLYAHAMRHLGREVPTLIEWDDRLPAFDALVAEAESARRVARRALAPAAEPRSVHAATP